MTVRAVRRADLDQVIAIDATVTGIEKRSYWQRVYRRYGIGASGEQRWFLVALAGGRVVGFLIGEVRDWEFGEPPCGWVFAIDIDPQARQAGIGSRLLSALSTSLRRAGVRKLRTLLARIPSPGPSTGTHAPTRPLRGSGTSSRSGQSSGSTRTRRISA